MILRYWHTLAPLLPVQLSTRISACFIDRRPRHISDVAVRKGDRSWRNQEWRSTPAGANDELTFLNRSYNIAAADIWNATQVPLLWLYNLHYFDDLTAVGAPRRRHLQRVLIHRWLSEHPAGARPGWDPYPTSLRLVNWIKTAWADDAEGRAMFTPDVLDSMATQADWLGRHVEHHLQANHLWANAKALTFAGACFTGRHAGDWLKQGTDLALRELAEQILPDGGHYERSPMYHAIVLEDVLDLIQLSQVTPGVLPDRLVERLHEVAPRMLRWLRVMSHPDGDVSFFNDAAFDVAPKLADLESYAHTLHVSMPFDAIAPVEWLKDSGYVRLTQGPAVAICDVAPIAPDYQPGHTHADTLSFEMSLHGRRAIVNSGTSTYERNNLRAWQRSTAAHNTVAVEGRNSSDVWAAFRVGKRARVRDVSVGEGTDGVWATGTHDGYSTWRRPLLHTRRWQLTPTTLTVTDHLSSPDREAEASLYLAPGITLGQDLQVHVTAPQGVAVTPAEWYPAFGRAEQNVRLRAPLHVGRLTTTITWAKAH